MTTEIAQARTQLSIALDANATIAMLQKHSLTGAVQQEIERLINSGELGPGD